MMLMGVLTVFLLLGCAAIWKWGAYQVEPPWVGDGPAPSLREAIRRYVWYVAVGIGAGVTSGLIMAGIAGRLAMRILAATASDRVQGSLTEADEIVGQITLAGSMDFIIFFGLLIGLPSGAAYLLIRRWLPKGLLGGLTFGALLLVLFSTRADPLRPDNVDFDLVGPGWLAVLIFVAMGLGHGMLLSALAGRYSKALPLISKDRKVLPRYIPAVLILPAIPAAAVAILLGAVYVGASLVKGVGRLSERRIFGTAGYALLALALLVPLPNFVSAVLDIASRP